MSIVKAALGFAVATYVNDVVVQPRQVGALARRYCDHVGKPLLLIRGESAAGAILGAPVKVEAEQRRAYPIRVPDKTFGAVLAVDTLERLKNPQAAVREWNRVADKVFAVVPSAWSLYAWLDPSNRWVIRGDRALPLWTRSRRVRLLNLSDRNPCTTTSSPQFPPMPRQTLESESAYPPFQPSPAYPATELEPEVETEEAEFYEEVTPGETLGLGRAPSTSSTSPSALMVISGPDSDEL